MNFFSQINNEKYNHQNNLGKNSQYEGDISTNKIDDAFMYWCSKGEITATVEIFVYEDFVHVSLSLS